jgi:hypothetical protein
MSVLKGEAFLAFTVSRDDFTGVLVWMLEEFSPSGVSSHAIFMAWDDTMLLQL